VPSTFSGSLSADADAVFKSVQLGDGTAAETSADTALASAIAGSKKDFTSIEYDGSNPYVTFVVQYDESEVNQSISEIAILSGRSPEDFLARKTFAAFTKTTNFTLEVRYTVRF